MINLIKNLKLSAARRSRLSGFSRGAFFAAAGGEMRSNYFKNTAQYTFSLAVSGRFLFC